MIRKILVRLLVTILLATVFPALAQQPMRLEVLRESIILVPFSSIHAN
jgi:hypothetical protein